MSKHKVLFKKAAIPPLLLATGLEYSSPVARAAWHATPDMPYDLVALHACMLRYSFLGRRPTARHFAARHLSERYSSDISHLTKMRRPTSLLLKPRIEDYYIEHERYGMAGVFGGGYSLLLAYSLGYVWARHFKSPLTPPPPALLRPGRVVPDPTPDYVMANGHIECLVESKGSFKPAADLKGKARRAFTRQVRPHLTATTMGLTVATGLESRNNACLKYIYSAPHPPRRGGGPGPGGGGPRPVPISKSLAFKYAESLAILLGFRRPAGQPLAWLSDYLQSRAETIDHVMFMSDADQPGGVDAARFGLHDELHAALSRLMGNGDELQQAITGDFSGLDQKMIEMPVFGDSVYTTIQGPRHFVHFPDGIVASLVTDLDREPDASLEPQFNRGGGRASVVTAFDDQTQRQVLRIEIEGMREDLDIDLPHLLNGVTALINNAAARQPSAVTVADAVHEYMAQKDDEKAQQAIQQTVEN